VGAVPHCRPLSELRRSDEPEFGGKSASLGELLSAEIPVPGGFGVSTSAFHQFISESAIGERIVTTMRQARDGDVVAVGATSEAIGEMIRSAPIPTGVRRDVERAYAELGGLGGSSSMPVAVRSSAVGEDSEDSTFAGQQETYLWMRGVEQVCDAIRDCWASLYSAPAISYRARLGEGAPDAAMGVTVQVMVDAERSGVMFTCNPLTGDPSTVAINASWGLGLAIVGGEVTPDDLLVNKVTREIIREQVNEKEIEYVPDPAGPGVLRTAVPADRSGQRCLDDETIGALMDIAGRVDDHFGSRQDIEWAIARDASDPERIYVVQSRPVTGIQQEKEPKPRSAAALVMRTFGAPARED
jgi:pyruvate,water dikinase